MSTIEIADKKDLGLDYAPVLAIFDYHDGPVSGVASFRGVPHYFHAVFDDLHDAYSDCYILTPLSREAFEAAEDIWAVFRRWRQAFDAGKANISLHPALPDEADDYQLARRCLEESLAVGRFAAVRAKGEFQPVSAPDAPRDSLSPWRVRWSESLGQPSRE